jgi:hypothetical protein
LTPEVLRLLLPDCELTGFADFCIIAAIASTRQWPEDNADFGRTVKDQNG